MYVKVYFGLKMLPFQQEDEDILETQDESTCTLWSEEDKTQ